MSTMTNWFDELRNLGYKGKLLNMLVEAIGDESNLGTFYKFSLDNDGKIHSKLSMVSRFVAFMQERACYQAVDTFTYDYESAQDDESRKIVIKKLFIGDIDIFTLNKVSEMLDKKILTFTDCYQKVAKYRKDYNCKEILTFIERGLPTI